MNQVKKKQKKQPPSISSPNKLAFIAESREEFNSIMQERQSKLKRFCRVSKAEEQAFNVIKSMTDLGVSRQSWWGNRFFDFWIHEKFIAIEIDGPEHRANFDEMRDRYNYIRSGILVFRAVNFDDARVSQIMEMVRASRGLSYRKENLGIGKGDAPGCNRSLLKSPNKAAIAWELVRYILDPRRKGTRQPDFKMNDGSYMKIDDLSQFF